MWLLWLLKRKKESYLWTEVGYIPFLWGGGVDLLMHILKKACMPGDSIHDPTLSPTWRSLFSFDSGSQISHPRKVTFAELPG